MEGLFHSLYYCPEWDTNFDIIQMCMVELDIDIGQFKKGEVIQEVHYNQVTHEVTLSKRDEDDIEIACFKFKVKVKVIYTPITD